MISAAGSADSVVSAPRIDEELHGVVKGITGGLSLDDALARILLAVEKLVDASSASIFLAESDGTIGTRRFTTRKTGEPHWDDHTHLRPGGITLTVLQTGQSIAIDDAFDDPRTRDVAQADRRALAAVPIRSDDRSIGVLYANWSHVRPYRPTDLALLEKLAAYGAIAIENARLHALEIAARRDAEEAHQRLQRFLASIAHDLEGPLTLVVAYGELLRTSTREDAVEVAERALPGMERAARRIQRLVKDLLVVSRIGARRFDILPAPTDLCQVLREVISQQQIAAPAHRLILRAPAHAEGEWDQVRIREVFVNLLSNAVKYSVDGGDVLVDVEVTDDFTTIRVVDEGIGISTAEMPRLFQPFSQLDAEPTTFGVGLGLYISKVIVEMHGGRIGVTSNVGRGSVFEVSLPRWKQAATAAH